MADYAETMAKLEDQLNCAETVMRLEAENERLKIELAAMRGAANSYKAEVERLREENKKQKAIIEAIDDAMNPLPFVTDFDKAIKTAQSEAVKKFAERLKNTKFKHGNDYIIYAENIDHLVKETEREKI